MIRTTLAFSAVALTALGISAASPAFAQTPPDVPPPKPDAWPGMTPAPAPGETPPPKPKGDTVLEPTFAPVGEPMPPQPAEPAKKLRTRRAPGPARFAEAYRPEPDEPSGLDQVVDLWGLSLMRTDFVDNPAATSNDIVTSINVQAIGIRYWLNGRFGVDAGLGFFDLAPDATNPTVWGVAPIIGVPVAISQWQYLTAYVKPQVSGFYVRFAEQKNRFQLALAALAGAEIHLGFLHVPALSLAFEAGGEFSFFGGRTPEIEDDRRSGPYTGYGLRPIAPPTLDGLFSNVALRIYF